MNPALRKPSALATLALALLCLLAAARSAEATFPGRPGLIVFNLTIHKDYEETGGLYAVRPGGHSPRQLTSNPDDLEPSFAPSGKRLVFQRLTGPTHAEPYYKTSLYTLEMGSGKLTRLTGGHGDTGPSFGRRGMIVFSRYVPGEKASDLFLRTVDGRLRRLTSGPGHDFHPVFTPDGRRIVFLRAVDNDWPQMAIFSIRLDGTGRRDLGHANSARAVDVSPDGRRLAFNAFARQLPEGDWGGIWTRRLDGGPLRYFSRRAEYAAWSPEGRRIAYSNSEGLWIRPAGGGARVQMLRADEPEIGDREGMTAKMPTWQPLP